MHDLRGTSILELQGETKNGMSNNILLGFTELFSLHITSRGTLNLECHPDYSRAFKNLYIYIHIGTSTS